MNCYSQSCFFPINIQQQCIGPSIQDCDQADLIIYLFTAALIYPIPMHFYIIVHTLVFYICNRTWFSLLKHQQFLWVACYSIREFYRREYKLTYQQPLLQLVLFIKFELKAYLDENRYPIIQAAMDGQRDMDINSQPQQLYNITLHQQIRQYQLLIRNLQIQMGSQQRIQLQDQIINQSGSAHQGYQPEVMGQNVPNFQQQHSGRSVPFQEEVKIR
ncbi:hypothetical protein pb186bvf_003178 [Paramecium bursaria]